MLAEAHQLYPFPISLTPLRTWPSCCCWPRYHFLRAQLLFRWCATNIKQPLSRKVGSFKRFLCDVLSPRDCCLFYSRGCRFCTTLLTHPNHNSLTHYPVWIPPWIEKASLWSNLVLYPDFRS